MLPAIKEIETDPGRFRIVLNQEFNGHKEAAFTFKQYLGGRELKRFNQIWEKYEEYANTHVRNAPLIVMLGTEVSPADPNDSEMIAQQRKKECLTHFNNLLKFTKKK